MGGADFRKGKDFTTSLKQYFTHNLILSLHMNLKHIEPQTTVEKMNKQELVRGADFGRGKDFYGVSQAIERN